MTLLPPLTELVTSDEFTMTLEEELRLLDDRPRNTRWWAAPYGTPPPAPDVDGVSFVAPWLMPWVSLNEPADDAMTAVMMVDREDLGARAGALLIMAFPTEAARALWEMASLPLHRGAPVALTLGAERVGGLGYRAIFPYVLPYPRVEGSPHLRFLSTPNPAGDRAAWEVFAVAEGVKP